MLIAFILTLFPWLIEWNRTGRAVAIIMKITCLIVVVCIFVACPLIRQATPPSCPLLTCLLAAGPLIRLAASSRWARVD